MPRKLPWLTQEPPSTGRPAKRQRLASPSTPKPLRRTAGFRNDDPMRTPSSSPPPQAPTQTPMKPTDKVWIMVEDEFYATAQLFTRHLHHAEYKKQRNLASKKTQEALRAIERPTRGVKANIEQRVAKAQDEKKRRAVEVVHEMSKGTRQQGQNNEDSSGEDEEEELAIGDRNLASLMQGTGAGRAPIRQKPALSALIGNAKPNTRAAAGFEKQDGRPVSRGNSIVYEFKDTRSMKKNDAAPLLEDEETDDEDLDAPMRPSEPSHSKPKFNEDAPTRQPPPTRDKRAGRPLPQDLPGRQLPASRRALHKDQTNTSSVFERLATGVKVSAIENLSTLGTSMSAKRATTKDKARTEAERKLIQLDEVPTFLF